MACFVVVGCYWFFICLFCFVCFILFVLFLVCVCGGGGGVTAGCGLFGFVVVGCSHS